MPPSRSSASPTPSARKKSARVVTDKKPTTSSKKSLFSALALLNPLDPTFLFLTNTFVSILFIEADDKQKTLSLKLPSLGMVASYFIDPACLIGLIELLCFLHFSRNHAKSLTRAQSLALHWHLWNGILIYTMMDGLNGAFSEYGFLPLLHERAYQLVDRRYRRHLVDQPPYGPSKYEVSLARTVNAMEVLIYSWMSIMAAVGIATKAKWHKTVEIMVLTMAAYGTIVFVVPDWFDGCLNMQPIGVAECAPPLTPFYFFFVYFGVVINWIWFLVPVSMLCVLVSRDFKKAK